MAVGSLYYDGVEYIRDLQPYFIDNWTWMLQTLSWNYTEYLHVCIMITEFC